MRLGHSPRARFRKPLDLTVVECDGCKAWPIRRHWLKKCPRCRRELCSQCFPVGDWCKLDDCKRERASAKLEGGI